MTTKQVAESIGYCRLVCALCHLRETCDGCKSDHNCCGRHTRPGGCFHEFCCNGRQLQGCWECPEGPCGADMFSEGHDHRLRAFVRFLKEHGPERLAELLLHNEARGVHYGHHRDYDHLPTEQAVLDLLTGAALHR